MRKSKTPKMKSFVETFQSVRGSWNGVNPVTKVERDKTKYSRKCKHKPRYDTES